MRVKNFLCESCGAELPLLRMRRLVWARVCPACEQALKVRGPDRRCTALPPDFHAGSETPIEPLVAGAAGWRPSAIPWRRLAAAILFYGTIVVAARLTGGPVRSLVGGALAAEILTWGLFNLARAPFEGVRFALDLFVRVMALVVVDGPGLPGLAEASRLDLGAIGFFSVLVLRALWFACWWNGLVDDCAGEYEESLPLGREC